MKAEIAFNQPTSMKKPFKVIILLYRFLLFLGQFFHLFILVFFFLYSGQQTIFMCHLINIISQLNWNTYPIYPFIIKKKRKEKKRKKINEIKTAAEYGSIICGSHSIDPNRIESINVIHFCFVFKWKAVIDIRIYSLLCLSIKFIRRYQNKNDEFVRKWRA